MNLDELRTVQVKEREADSLQSLPESFYADVAEYIQALRTDRERAAERASDPFDSAEVRQLSDEIETAEEVVEAIYERRVGKVVKRASIAAAGMPADDEGMTAEEAELFTDLVGRIQANRGHVLDVVAGETASDEVSPDDVDAGSRDHGEPTPIDSVGSRGESESEPEPEPEPESGESEPPEPAFTASEALGGDAPTGETDPPTRHETGTTADDDLEIEQPHDREDDRMGHPDEAADADGEPPVDPGDDSDVETDRVTVRITRDIGEIFGIDEHVYDLATEDVVTLPTANARPLIDREAAEKVE